MHLLYEIPQTDMRQPHVLKNRNINLPAIKGVTALPADQLAIIMAMMMDENPTDAVEIGTNTGCTTRWMALAMPQCNVHTLDLPPDWKGDGPPKTDLNLIQSNRSYIGKDFRDSGLHNIRQHYGDSATYDFANFGHPTFFFIDGSHSFDYVINDTRKCVAAAGHGSIVWHDCGHGHDDVIRALLHLMRHDGMNIFRLGYGLAWARF